MANEKLNEYMFNVLKDENLSSSLKKKKEILSLVKQNKGFGGDKRFVCDVLRWCFLRLKNLRE